MMKIFLPFCVAKNLYEIETEFYIKNNIKYIFCDLDNTLESFKVKEASEEAKALKEKLAKAGIELIVVSNNTKRRVSIYAESLGARFVYSARKPFRHRIRVFIKKNNINLKECMLIGDQLLTDIVCGNRLKIKAVLCENLVVEDQFITKINKFFDGMLRRYMHKKQLVKSWREV